MKGCNHSEKTLKIGDKGPVVQEINIRLAGFGGGVPSDTFDATTEKKVKNFERDYMKRQSQSGIVNEAVAKALDEFGNKYLIPFDELKCKCGSCQGFGHHLHKDEYRSQTKLEIYNKYEYPGIHRMLLWGIKGLMYHLESEHSTSLKIGKFFSVYRCWNDNKKNGRSSTNHMGKAADLHIYTKENGSEWFRPTEKSQNTALCNKVRDVCASKLNAQIEWKHENQFSLEPSTGTVKADTWVHIDVRMFNHQKYLTDNFFCTDMNSLNKKPFTALIKEAQ